MTKAIVAACVVAMIVSVAPARAQGALSAAVLQLAKNAPPGVVRPISGGRLYGGIVCATIIDGNTSTDDFAAQDRVAFTIVPRKAVTTPGVCPSSAGLQFLAPGNPDPSVGTRSQFEAWASANARALFNILFPGGLSAALLGADAAHVYGQQLMLTTVLGADAVRRTGAARPGAAGLAEVEWFTRSDSPDSAGTALQGLYDFTPTFSVQGRFANHSEDLRTRAVTVAADFHPYRELNRPVAVMRVGAVARSGITYANASAANRAPLPSSSADGASREPTFGSIDVAGGGFASAFKDLGRTRIVFGALLQGSESHVAAAWLGRDYGYLADAINGRGLDLDLSWGGSVGYDLTNRTVLIAKYLQTDNVKSGLEADLALSNIDLGKPVSRTAIAGVAYRAGALRFSGGYRFASSGDISANAIFFRGNVDW